MPSSPPSPLSPAIERDRELVDFGRARGCRRAARPTLEWACAAARVSGHRHRHRRLDQGGENEGEQGEEEGEEEGEEGAGEEWEEDMDVDEMVLDPSGGDTEDEMEDTPHEALTPSSSVDSQGSAGWRGGKKERRARRAVVVPVDVEATPKPVVKTVSDQDVMEAALALCGLGARR